jgi:peptidoglycan/LPS O-acetylase OafA/YrhL
MSEQRGTTSRFYRPELDALRFMAFFLVFCHHSVIAAVIDRVPTLPMPEQVLSWVALGGGFGVDLFFILSAYLISELLLREKSATGQVDVRSFYIRRILRIWPLYFAFIVFCFILPKITSSSFPLKALLCFVFLAGNWYCVVNGAIPSPVSPLWSVSIEEQFYLVWPLIVRIAKRTQIIAIAFCLIIVAFAARWTLLAHAAPRRAIWFNTFTRLDDIALGVLIAVLLNGRIPKIHPGLRAILFSGGITLLGLSTGWFRVLRDGLPIADGLLGYGCGTIAGVLLFFSFLGGPQDGLKFLTFRPLVYLGRISYGLYVVHQFVLEATKVTLYRLMGHSPTELRFLLAIPPTVILAAVSYRWLESPFLRLKSRYEQISSGAPSLDNTQGAVEARGTAPVPTLSA